MGFSPCVQYSSARTTAKKTRDLEGADKLILRAMDIINYFSPECYFIENPWRGLLRHRAIMAHLPTPKKASYCKYGYCYQKHTALWTNTEIQFLVCKNDCCSLAADPSVDVSGRRRRRHESRAQRGGYLVSQEMTTGHSLKQLYSIPPQLCRHICTAVYYKDNGPNQGNLRGAQLPRSGAPKESTQESGDPIYKRTSE